MLVEVKLIFSAGNEDLGQDYEGEDNEDNEDSYNSYDGDYGDDEDEKDEKDGNQMKESFSDFILFY